MKERHWTQKQLLNNLLEKKMGGLFSERKFEKISRSLDNDKKRTVNKNKQH